MHHPFQKDATQGLTSSQAQQLLEQFGKNELTAEKSPSLFFIFCSQFIDPLIYLLVAAAAIIFFVGQSLDAFIICGILIFNAIIGTIQEKRAENILQTLQALFRSNAVVVRDGVQQILASNLLVPGDIIHLAAGDKIPADAQLLQAHNLTIDESMLTGESVPVEKQVELNNEIFSGTLVISGQAIASITATGNTTKGGQIHKAVETINTNTPLQQEMEKLAHSILIFVLIICSSLVAIGILTHKPLVDLLTMVTALFICIVPEGLPVVMTLVLISGAYKMAQRNVLIKNLKALEGLGRVNTIITDKTGTLTRNEMVVSNVFVDNTNLQVSGTGYFPQGTIEHQAEHQSSLQAIAKICTLLNDTVIEFHAHTNTFTVQGDPTQAAAFIFAQKITKQVDTVLQNYVIPFDSAYRYKAIFYTHNNQHMVGVLGAPEVVLAACDNISKDVHQQLEQYVSKGYRVVAVAQKTYAPSMTNSDDSANYHNLATSNLNFLGLLAISDEPRENLANIIQQVHDAGIQIIMATGDHPQTAAHVAEKVGIVTSNSKIIVGDDLATLNDQQLNELLHDNAVCARFSPQDKLRLVQLLHKHGKVVATTGDGINDVPALVASDVSIAMGSTGTHVTKQAADIILLQDSFENIVYAIQEGKNMLYALRRTILYFLASNMGEVLVVFFALIASLPLPLLPAQILWLNLITDGFLDLALAMEPNHDSALSKPRSDKHQTSLQKLHKKNPPKIFDATIICKMFYLALPMSLVGIFTFITMYQTDIALARTVTLVTLAMFQWFNALNCRSETLSIFQIGLFSNFWLTVATITVFFLQALVVYAPFMQQIFKTVPLTPAHWLYAVGIASSILIIEEIRKFIMRR